MMRVFFAPTRPSIQPLRMWPGVCIVAMKVMTPATDSVDQANCSARGFTNTAAELTMPPTKSIMRARTSIPVRLGSF